MDSVQGTRRGAFLAAALTIALGAAPAGAQATFGLARNVSTAALGEFGHALQGVRDYTTTVTVFERLNDGSRVETRTYAFRSAGAQNVSAAVVDGPGKGSSAVWAGGDSVRTHQGGSLSQIRLTVPIDDPRVQSLRGDTIDTGTFSYDLQYMLGTPGTLAEAAGPKIDGAATRAVTLTVKDPPVAAVTKVVLYLSTATHLPVRRSQYVGATVVKTETFRDTRINAGLRPRDLDA